MGGFPDPLDALDAVAARAIDAVDPPPDSAPVRVPFGRGLEIDVEHRRYLRSGSRPLVTTGLDTLRNWCMVVAHSARGAHRALPPDLGVARPGGPVGYGAGRAEAAADWALEVRAAWLEHDRISDVTIDDVVIDVEGMEDTSYVEFSVFPDEGESFPIQVELAALEEAA